jgi:small subunit ribosomal protein S8
MEERTERVERTGAATGMPPGERPPPRPRSAPPPQKKARRRGPVLTDPVADMLTRLRNASRARHDVVSIPTSRLKVEIAKILKAEGFLVGYEVAGPTLTCRVKYVGGGKIPALTDAQRLSTPGRRTYAGRRELPRVRGGLGVTIVSTSQGLLTGTDAARKGLGGEVLCAVW